MTEPTPPVITPGVDRIVLWNNSPNPAPPNTAPMFEVVSTIDVSSYLYVVPARLVEAFASTGINEQISGYGNPTFKTPDRFGTDAWFIECTFDDPSDPNARWIVPARVYEDGIIDVSGHGFTTMRLKLRQGVTGLIMALGIRSSGGSPRIVDLVTPALPGTPDGACQAAGTISRQMEAYYDSQGRYQGLRLASLQVQTARIYLAGNGSDSSQAPLIKPVHTVWRAAVWLTGADLPYTPSVPTDPYSAPAGDLRNTLTTGVPPAGAFTWQLHRFYDDDAVPIHISPNNYSGLDGSGDFCPEQLMRPGNTQFNAMLRAGTISWCGGWLWGGDVSLVVVPAPGPLDEDSIYTDQQGRTLGPFLTSGTWSISVAATHVLASISDREFPWFAFTPSSAFPGSNFPPATGPVNPDGYGTGSTYRGTSWPVRHVGGVFPQSPFEVVDYGAGTVPNPTPTPAP